MAENAVGWRESGACPSRSGLGFDLPLIGDHSVQSPGETWTWELLQKGL
jgi:hypothetical protein